MLPRPARKRQDVDHMEQRHQILCLDILIPTKLGGAGLLIEQAVPCLRIVLTDNIVSDLYTLTLFTDFVITCIYITSIKE